MRSRLAYGVSLFAVASFGVLLSGEGNQTLSNKDVMASVPAPFKPLFDFGIRSGNEEAVWKGFPYDVITLERTRCYGTCPAYTVTFSRGGKADLRSENWRQMKGNYSGEINVFDYGKLCYLMKEMGFEELATRYAGTWTDAPTVIVSASWPGGRKSVSDYSSIGPIRLWAIQQAIDAVATGMTWKGK